MDQQEGNERDYAVRDPNAHARCSVDAFVEPGTEVWTSDYRSDGTSYSGNFQAIHVSNRLTLMFDAGDAATVADCEAIIAGLGEIVERAKARLNSEAADTQQNTSGESQAAPEPTGSGSAQAASEPRP